MSEDDQISARYPKLGRRLGRLSLASLPTPLVETEVSLESGRYPVLIKNDGLTGAIYGGNKVRKLEYALWPAIAHGKSRVATFGAVGSNHALATALYARQLGLDCTCFLVHQHASARVAGTLCRHLVNRTHIVRFGGSYAKRIALLRQHLGDRESWVVPAGGSSWRGSVGFVNAGLELAAQLAARHIAAPDRIYMATGTMGSAAGLALGLAMAGLRSEVHAVRVTDVRFASEEKLRRLGGKIAYMLQRLDPATGELLAVEPRIRMRHEFFAGGYAQSDPRTDQAVDLAHRELGLALESTYTGKTMAALLHDLPGSGGRRFLFWNTCNAVASPGLNASQVDADKLPAGFRRYLA